MSLISTYNSASVRGWQASGTSIGNYIQTQRIQGNSVGDSLGSEVAISKNGEYMLAANSSGVLVYNKSGSTYILQTTLTPSDGSITFGGAKNSMALNEYGNIATIGAFAAGTAGKTFIFSRIGNTWTEEVILQPSTGGGGQNFGVATTINSVGNIIAVGASRFNASGLNADGKVYLYTGSGNAWTLQTDITIGSNVQLGRDVSLNNLGNILLIGAPGYNSNEGRAYLYGGSGNTWTQLANISSPSNVANLQFGQMVSLNSDGSVGIIGSVSPTLPTPTANSFAQIYNFNSNNITNFQANNSFGEGVVIDGTGTIAIIGQPYATTGNSNTSNGQAIFYSEITTNNYSNVQTLTPTGGNASGMGGVIAMSSDGINLIFGCPGDDQGGGSTGSLVIFTGT
jgi:hypothetical protein